MMFKMMLRKTLAILAFIVVLALGLSWMPQAKAEDASYGYRMVYCYDNYGQIIAYGVERDFAGTERDFAGTERDFAGVERNIARGVERDFHQDPNSVTCYFF